MGVWTRTKTLKNGTRRTYNYDYVKAQAIIPTGWDRKLREIAKAEGCTVAKIVRRFVHAGLEAQGAFRGRK